MIPVKICGITNSTDANLALGLGAAALGFIFYPPSPRYIDPRKAAEIIAGIDIPTVGVFVNEPAERITEIVDITGISLAQLHGDESPAICAVLPVPVIKGFRVQENFDPAKMLDYPVRAWLVDSYRTDQYGGTGHSFDWSLVKSAERHRPLVLAGGLNPDNVLDAVEKVRPAALDLSSGVEIEPGRKDPDKLWRLFANLKETGAYDNPFWTEKL